MTYRFSTIRQLDAETKAFIRTYMSWPYGAMADWLNFNCGGVCLCLVYQRKNLIAWAAVDYQTWPRRDSPVVGAWTLKEYRRQGIAQKAIKQVLRRWKPKPGVPIEIGSDITAKCVQKLGYEYTDYTYGYDWAY